MRYLLNLFVYWYRDIPNCISIPCLLQQAELAIVLAQLSQVYRLLWKRHRRSWRVACCSQGIYTSVSRETTATIFPNRFFSMSIWQNCPTKSSLGSNAVMITMLDITLCQPLWHEASLYRSRPSNAPIFSLKVISRGIHDILVV